MRSGSLKNILFVSHSENLQGGAEVSLVELLKSAKERGYTPFLAVPAEGDLSKKAKALGIACLAVLYFRWGMAGKDPEKLADLNAVPELVAFIEKHKIAAVVSNTLVVPWGAVAAAMADAPHVWVAREFFAHHRSYLQGHYEFVKGFSNAVIANSKSNAAYLRDTVGIKGATHFHSYVDTKDLKLAKDISEQRIVCIGIVHPDKNQLEVLQAVAELKQKKRLGVGKVLFFGRFRDDAYFHELRGFIDRHDLDDVVVFKGFAEDPYAQIGPSDILIQPSKHESLGRTITEAMKVGLICVGADIAGTSEAMELGGGTLYKSGDSHDLAQKLAAIFADPRAYREKADKAQARALANLSEAASHQPFFDALAKVLGQPNPRREMGHLRKHFEGLHSLTGRLEELHLAEKKAEGYRQLAEDRRRDMQDILNSRTWKTVALAGRARSLPSKLAATLNRRKAIHVVYLERRKLSGSTVMRGDQLAGIAEKALGRKVYYSDLDLNSRNSILFLTKWALAGLKPEYLDKLKSNNNVLLFDPVDAALPDFTKDYADIVVAASRTAYEDYKRQLPGKRVMLVNHHVDPRIKFDKSQQPDTLAAAYFGEKVNAFTTSSIEAVVDFVQINTNNQESQWFHLLSDYNLHYAVRQIEQRDNHKPFLKGFTAARCDSNILIQDSQPEAMMWLGEDYPYLLKGKVTEEKVLEMLRRIRESFGSKEWQRGLEIMRYIREETSEKAIGRQLVDLFREAGS